MWPRFCAHRDQKEQPRQVCPDDWVNFVASSNWNYNVTKMTYVDFVYIEALNEFFPKKVKDVRKM